MLRIRLQRRGKRGYATYRVVVADQHAPIKGRFIDDLGSYNPHTNEFKVAEDKVQEWLKRGAQPSDTVHNLMVTHGLLKEEKVVIWRPKKEAIPEKAAETAAADAGKKEKAEK